MATTDTLSTATSGQAAGLNAINSATAEAIRLARKCEQEARQIAEALEAGLTVSHFGLAREAINLDTACARRQEVVNLGHAVGCIDGHLALAAMGQGGYFRADPVAV